MKRRLLTHTPVVFLACLHCCEVLAQQEDSPFVTLLSAPGKTEVVRHPQAQDWSRRPGRGKIASLPAYHPESQQPWQVDLRSCDLSSLDLRDRLTDLLQADFDSRTVWPASLPSEFNVSRIMELGRNPGLGLKAVHRRGITGAGVGLAIIDLALLVDHVEYRDRLRLYEEIDWLKDSPADMHGSAVASIAVGRTVGVAPEADLYYIAEWPTQSAGMGRKDYELSSLAQAIDRLAAINVELPSERRIRVISISLGIHPGMAGFDRVKQSIAAAEQQGIYTVYVGSEPFGGLGRSPLSDPDLFESFSPGQFWIRSWKDYHYSLLVPMDCRCVAAPNGNEVYAFIRTGGMSWTVPWVAGLYALACQVKPNVTAKEFWEAAQSTAVPAHAVLDGNRVEFGHIMNPSALLDFLGDAKGDEPPHSSDRFKTHRAILECRAPDSDGPFMSLYSFSAAGPAMEPQQADLCFYFDSDDCSGGAIVGHDDDKGWLFPMGKRSWQELRQRQKPPADGASTEALTPITVAQEGFAFWVRTVDGRHAIVRIAAVQPATYNDLLQGKTARIEFEWMWR